MLMQQKCGEMSVPPFLHAPIDLFVVHFLYKSSFCFLNTTGLPAGLSLILSGLREKRPATLLNDYFTHFINLNDKQTKNSNLMWLLISVHKMSRGKTDVEIEKDLLDEAMPLIYDCLDALLDAKPQDGVEFLADFFQSQVKSAVPGLQKK